MLTRRLSRSERIAVGGGLLLILAMFVPATEVERVRKPPGVL
jgi:hypothetical protein